MTTRRERRKLRRRARRMAYGYSWCDCGAPMARNDANLQWECSDILRGQAVPSGQPGSLRHSDRMPYVFWKVKSLFQDPGRREPRNQPEAVG